GRVEVLDAGEGYLGLGHGGRAVTTREALSEYTAAIAMSRWDDKRITRKVVGNAGIRVPRGRTATLDGDDEAFLEEVGSLVVKPVRGEQGKGVTVAVRTPEDLRRAIARAGGPDAEVLLEEVVEGEDLRIVVIDGAVVAAAVRKPAEVVGTGTHTVRELIEAHSRRRAAATGGESRIPIDDLTTEMVHEAGLALDDVLEASRVLRVRRTANLHTGGTIHDVTDELHPTLARAAIRAADAIEIPVTGIDLLVPDPSGPEYAFIEANERPGLANHEPQPTAAAFVDYLLPSTRPTPWAWQPSPPSPDAVDAAPGPDEPT
ncbi:MAG: hypothetical protein KDA97_04585, partial [Acidimicrobiales bacterium]|nr:hypothetical protein [Acidimicrobiales bacterium]